MNYLNKQPSEIFPFSFDFVDCLDVAETIISKTVTAIELVHNADVTSTVIDSSSINGTKIVIKVQAGIDRVDYKITIKVTTSGGNIFEEDVIMNVVEE